MEYFCWYCFFLYYYISLLIFLYCWICAGLPPKFIAFITDVCDSLRTFLVTVTSTLFDGVISFFIILCASSLFVSSHLRSWRCFADCIFCLLLWQILCFRVGLPRLWLSLEKRKHLWVFFWGCKWNLSFIVSSCSIILYYSTNILSRTIC